MDPTPAGNLVSLLMAIFSLLNSGAELHKAGKFAEAVDVYSKVLVVQEEAHVPTAATRYMRAEAEMELKRFPGARADFFAALYQSNDTVFLKRALARYVQAGGDPRFAPRPGTPYRTAQTFIDALGKQDYAAARAAMSATLAAEYPLPVGNERAATWEVLGGDFNGYRVHVEGISLTDEVAVPRLFFTKYKDAGEVPILSAAVFSFDLQQAGEIWQVTHIERHDPARFWRELDGQLESKNVHFNRAREPEAPKVVLNENQAILVEQQNMQALVGALRGRNMQMGGLVINGRLQQQDAPAESERPLWKHPGTGETFSYVYRPGIIAGMNADEKDKTLLAAAPLVVEGQRDVLYTDESTARLPEATFQKLRADVQWEAPQLLPQTSIPTKLRAQIEGLIKDLGASDPQVRLESRAALVELGDQATAQLLANRNHTDPEVRLTIRELLRRTEAKTDNAPEGQQRNVNGQPLFIQGIPPDWRR